MAHPSFSGPGYPGPLLVALAGVVTAGLVFFASRPSHDTRAFHNADASSSVKSDVPVVPAVRLTDAELEQTANDLLAAVRPHLPENHYFPGYAKDKLGWALQEHRAGRLTVAPFVDPDSIRLPSDVLMAAARMDGHPTIFISMPRFDSFLREPGHSIHPFSRQLINTFAIGLVHEILHLQNPSANPRDPDPQTFIREEFRVYREVNLGVVRPLRSLNQPMSQYLLDVDDVLRLCGDELPCAALARIVRLDRPRPGRATTVVR